MIVNHVNLIGTMKNVSFKLIFRSWRRNKTFAVISILSLAVGIACTNLLAAFVVHERNIEAENPNRERIYCLVQDSPFQSGAEIFFASDKVLSMIKDRYPEVEDCLCLKAAGVSQVTVGDKMYDPITVILAGTSLPRFFPYQTVAGKLEEALTEPDKIALTTSAAHRFFGKEDPIGQILTMNHSFPEERITYQVAAVVEAYEQSYLSFDAIIAPRPEHDGSAFILTNRALDTEAFAVRLREDGIPTLQGDIGRYFLYPLRENYFKEYEGQSLRYIRYQNKQILYIGLFSASLILLIACFNYINLNFSRLLQQVKMIRVQCLLGATRADINKQLFLDIFFTVLIGFLLSVFIMYELIPVFNSILQGGMKASFVFSGQVLPVLTGLVIILTVIPALYIGRKIASCSRDRSVELTRGRRKQGILSALSVVQFAISIALLIATMTVNRQIGLIRHGGERFRGLIEVGGEEGDSMKPFVEELRTHPELGDIYTTGTSLINYWVRQIIRTDPDGNESYLTLAQFYGDTAFLSAFQIELLQGMRPEEAVRHFSRPAYVNQRFVDVLVGKGEYPVGKPLKNYDKDFDSGNKEDGSREHPVTTIAGVVQDFFTATGSLEKEISPTVIYITDEMIHSAPVAYFRPDSRQTDRLGLVEQIWEKRFPGVRFAYRNVYDEFLTYNRKTFGLANLLLMYSLISIFLTCFGLFGIALYAAEQRTKEIGIRKVNGATVWQIIALLNKQFLLWIGIAFLIAVPIVWLLLNRWLQGFVYRAELSVSVFLVALSVVTGIALLTVSRHSYKAASGRPVDALRDE
jgi:hypothetical protein